MVCDVDTNAKTDAFGWKPHLLTALDVLQSLRLRELESPCHERLDLDHSGRLRLL